MLHCLNHLLDITTCIAHIAAHGLEQFFKWVMTVHSHK